MLDIWVALGGLVEDDTDVVMESPINVDPNEIGDGAISPKANRICSFIQ